jgi:hypothetical protein
MMTEGVEPLWGMADRLDGHQDRVSGNHPPDDADGPCEERVDILAGTPRNDADQGPDELAPDGVLPVFRHYSNHPFDARHRLKYLLTHS